MREIWVYRIPMRDWNDSVICDDNMNVMVYRIPMRDWNLSCSLLCWISCLSFIEYLWGIETRKFIVQLQEYGMFIEYLWGIETSQSSHTHGSRTKFIEYLWGIETGHYCHFLLQQSSFIEYLWGIETMICWWRRQRAHSVYRIPMRDWNCPEDAALIHKSASL